jgi:hypothetical protein
MPTTGLTEVLAALSLATDLGSGFAPEKGLRTCLVALAVGRQAGMDDRDLADVFQGALLQALGCTAYATENAGHFDDDLAFQRAVHSLDVTDPASLASFGSWAGEQRGARVAITSVWTVRVITAGSARCRSRASRGCSPRLT